MIDDVAAIVEHLCGDGLSVFGLVESTDIFDDDFDVRIDGVDALFITGFEFLNGLEIHTADETDLFLAFSIGLEASSHTDEEGAFVLSENGGADVRRVRNIVDKEELLIGEVVGDLGDSILEEEARGDDQVFAGVGESGELRDVIGVRRGLNVLNGILFELVICGIALDAFPGALVKGFVVDAAGIGAEADGDGGEFFNLASLSFFLGLFLGLGFLSLFLGLGFLYLLLSLGFLSFFFSFGLFGLFLGLGFLSLFLGLGFLSLFLGLGFLYLLLSLGFLSFFFSFGLFGLFLGLGFLSLFLGFGFVGLSFFTFFLSLGFLSLLFGLGFFDFLLSFCRFGFF